MNWDAIAAVAELVGALGVIASLAYLGLQVKHNTHQMRLNAESLGMAHEMGGVEMSIAVASTLLTDPELTDVVRRARSDAASLSPADRVRWGTYLWCSLLIFQAGHQNFLKGLADSEAWEAHAGNLSALMDNPGARAWWARNRGRFNSRFGAFVDGVLEPSPTNRNGPPG